ncbi:hypothetical protein BD311DRAFT_126376 [Dichomitus squalens]|uniref:Uncharacterized protein n=1 Tax=Dichomitus squalens TaxID=114155 RepID=A0A4Q9M6Z0_9APHY|nr:hypothetical protein BD311DRAFT_126376 [Dichomitus squalens]
MNIAYILSQLAPCSFSTMRVLALSRMNRVLAVVTFAISIMPAIVYLTFNVKWVQPENQPQPYNCGLKLHTPMRLQITTIIAECIVFVITLRYAHPTLRVLRDVKIGPSLTSVMFYTGSLYFLVIASFNAIDFGFESIERKEFGSTTTPAGMFADALTSILLSRFILSLRQVDYDSARQSDASASLAIHFATQVQSGNCSLPRSFASLAEPVHLDTPDPDMEWAPTEDKEPSRLEEAKVEVGLESVNDTHSASC